MAWLAEERRRLAEEEAERRRVSINYGMLGRIRNDADVVKGKLLDGMTIEDEDAAPIEPTLPTVEPVPSQTPHEDESREHTFLRLMLTGGDWRQYLRSVHVPEGVMVENINNEMMDKIGDIAIEDNGDGIQLIEDYREDIERLIYNNV